VATTYSQPSGILAAPVVPKSKGRIVVNWITSTDHKTIGYMYLIASFVFFCFGGVMALLIRAELFEPGMQILQTKEQYNQLFTMHGRSSPASPTSSCRSRSVRPTSRSRA
jgi:cytochrome c oxidase subunit I